MVQPVGFEPCSYEQFTAGLTFKMVRDELALEQRQARENGLYRFVTRSTVLGRMRQYKQSAYADYVRWMNPDYERSN